MEQMQEMEYSKQLMMEISILNFTVYDLILYMDTHPYDMEAKEYYGRFQKSLMMKQKEFAMKFYPLMQCYCDGRKDWSWENGPLPWEGGCR